MGLERRYADGQGRYGVGPRGKDKCRTTKAGLESACAHTPVETDHTVIQPHLVQILHGILGLSAVLVLHEAEATWRLVDPGHKPKREGVVG